MQQIILSGNYPTAFADQNPSPYSDPRISKEKKLGKYQALYGGLFKEVFEQQATEAYRHFVFDTKTKKLKSINTAAQENELIDPVAFAYDFGARMYDARLGRWMSTDPLQTKYPSMSPYNGLGDNPIIFIDTDGKKIILSLSFRNSSYLNIYNDIIKNNSYYASLLKPYSGVNNTNNYTLNCDNLYTRAFPNADGVTFSSYSKGDGEYSTPEFNADTHLFIDVMNSTIKTIDTKCNELVTVKREFSSIYKAVILFHEGIHGMENSKNQAVNGEQQHNHFAKYQNKILNFLIEYNKDNNLGLTNEQLNDLSWAGTCVPLDNKQFENYISDKAKKNNRSFDAEFEIYKENINKLKWENTEITSEEWKRNNPSNSNSSEDGK